MNSLKPEEYLRSVPQLHDAGKAFSRGLHEVIRQSKPLRLLADLLHGTWLGHPLHPFLTDVAIGAWMSAGILDLLASQRRSRSLEKAADQLTALGTASAVPTALAGIVDYTTIPRRAFASGAAHGLLNAVGLVLYLLSSLERSRGKRSRGIFYSSTALGLLGVSAWLGGELVYKYKVGVNKSDLAKGPQDWQAVIGELELAEGQRRRVEVEGHPVLLYRYGGAFYAIGAVCGHDGGPLEEGNFDGLCVECPWHHSVFDLRDGNVVHGPSTVAVSSFETRVRSGMVELRLRES
jgi:nitrite reductase/ring-hydroxylating ferredoxin subunit/uncharacterized membrane protein